MTTPRMEKDFLKPGHSALTGPQSLRLMQLTIGSVRMVTDPSAYHYIDSLREQHEVDSKTILDLIDKVEELVKSLDAETLLDVDGEAYTALRDTLDALATRRSLAS